ncbi:MAG: ABC transporter ATP-binding protein [Atribacterota bacterium]|nr:ABC transporter ATP-binding protein [Atribacterota bacterium]MDD4895191.1 ABC transporter ATP-binding protein [Atribacterota bacterium]MDD5637786.1 ABC transporter ATP-binding protein [Atribacterota bacterium]
MTETSDSIILRLDHLTKYFGGVPAVKEVSFSIQEGALVGLIGPNGSGKTTIFNLITGVYPPDNGSIYYQGEDITSLKTYEIIGRRIARTFQNLRLFPHSTALENVMVAMQQHHSYSFGEAITHLGNWKKKEREIESKSIDILSRVGLVERSAQKARTLPYGMQRRLEIARAIALEPKFLFLDEPAAGMNPEEVNDLNALIIDIHKELKFTILVIEHHMDLVMEICPHIICMNFGNKIAEGNPLEIQSHPEVLKAYLGEEEVEW